ncbi:MAG: DUF1838 family protein [Gammaproteobacteria bacterium]|nr:DUF1838 family protein [Gammaproteobacteria bacterium]
MTRAPDYPHAPALTRRQALIGGSFVAGLPLAGVAAVATSGTAPPVASIDAAASSLDRPSERIRLLLRALSTLDASTESYIFLQGTAYGWVPGAARPEPLFGSAFLTVSRVESLPGRYRLMTNQLALITDLKDGSVIDTWRNPYLDEEVRVFHGHNGPQDIEFDVARLDVAMEDAKGGRIQASLDVPWTLDAQFARTETQVRSRRKNPLDIARWPREHAAEQLDVTEWSEWIVPRSLLATDAPMLPCRASTQRYANWFPWMLMGQRPGSVFARTSGGRIGSLDELPASFLRYAQKHHPGYLAAPKQWTGQFVDVLSVFARERSPTPERAPTSARPPGPESR